ncbi:FUSC family protein [Acidimangrovimonas sediminis]|uniref:FUSC family protein n=1 Tax=Acidimangrovimonas sediminis TaxID=2056283 RepID=UPI000C8068D1|nr:FUSC family protein [Acidimangrovimonas sediminis]
MTKSSAILRLPAAVSFDRAQAINALKVTLAIVLSLWVAFLFDLSHTYWALLTVPPIVTNPSAGNMVWRGVARLAATILGAIVGLVFVAAFNDSRVAMIAALVILVFLLGYLSRLYRAIDAYAYATAAVTAMLVGVEGGQAPAGAYDLALQRGTETAIPIVCCFALLLILFPRSVSEDAMAKLKGARAKTFEAARAMLSDAPGRAAARMGADAALQGVHTDLDALIFERGRRRWLYPRLTGVCNALNRIIALSDLARYSLDRLSAEEREGRVAQAEEAVFGLLERAEAPGLDAEAQRANAAAARAVAEGASPGNLLIEGKTPTHTTFKRGTALWRLLALTQALEAYFEAEAALIDRSTPVTTPKRTRHRYHDHVAALESGLRPALILLILSVVWITTRWQAGQIISLVASFFTMVIAAIAPRPVRPLAGKFMVYGVLLGSALTLPLMAALALVEGFPAFALLLGVVIFTIFYTAKGPPTLAIGAVVAIALELSPTDQPLYDPVNAINYAVTLVLFPLTYLIAQALLFPENAAWLKRRAQGAADGLLKLAARRRPSLRQAEFLSASIDIMGEYGSGLDPEEAEGQHLILRIRAVQATGLCLYRLRELAAAPETPDDLAPFVERLRREALRAARGGAPADGNDFFDELDAYVRRHAGRHDLSREARIAALRFGGLANLLASIIASGELAPDFERH